MTEAFGLYSRIALFEARRFLAYKNELVGLLLGRLAPITIVIVFWSIVSESQEVALTLEQIIAYFLMLSGIVELTSVRNFVFGLFIGRQIERGELSAQLLRPLPIVPALIARFYGRTLPYKLLSICYIIVGLLLAPPLSLAVLATGLFWMLIAIIISMSMSIIVASLAFWVTRIDSIRITAYFSINLFTGFYIPLNLMPERVQDIVFALPMAYFAYAPTITLTGGSLRYSFLLHATIAIGWVVALSLLAVWLWRRGFRSYDSVGL